MACSGSIHVGIMHAVSGHSSQNLSASCWAQHTNSGLTQENQGVVWVGGHRENREGWVDRITGHKDVQASRNSRLQEAGD